jgi:hypothetical protein
MHSWFSKHQAYIVLFVETPRKFITAKQCVSTNKTIYFIAMQTYKELIKRIVYTIKVSVITGGIYCADINSKFLNV